MNYLVLNGIKSTSVKGLLIQSLPPISKPQIRTSIETIDGRDGDIVTKLGYSAYDKEVSIGLHGDFDIDDAIRYFDSEGTVVFSNEPDKYYRYQILDQIDFERLIRFRTATVKFHVQPFKYDDVAKELSITNQFISVPDYRAAKNGVTVSVIDEKIVVSGAAETWTEFYIPIDPLKLKAGNYTFTAKTSGTAGDCAIRLIADMPSDSRSFGKTYVELISNRANELKANDTGELKYTYLWLYFFPAATGATTDFSMTVTMAGDSFNSLEAFNRGNTISRPKVTIYGNGAVDLSLNGVAILQINVDQDYIVIDTAEMNAYHDGTLKNRQVTGDYENLVLKNGKNTLSWSGNVTEVKIEDFSRWI